MQAQTKIKLGATAGLRLLPEGKADVILDEVRKFLKQYPFQLDDTTGVTILDGELSNQKQAVLLAHVPACFGLAPRVKLRFISS